MKHLFIWLLVIAFLDARSFEQTFNIQVITPVQKHLGESRTYYGTAKFDERRIRDIVLRHDAYVTRLDANATYLQIRSGQKLFDFYSPKIYDLQKELQSSLGHKSLERNVMERLKLLGVDAESIRRMRTGVYEELPYYSPFAGVLIEKEIVEGAFVRKGQRLFRVVDNSQMWVEAKVYQKDLSYIRHVRTASVRFDGLEGRYAAGIDTIYPEVDAKDQTLRIRLHVNNTDRAIAQHMFATIDFMQEAKSVLMLPKEAIIRRDGKFYVFARTAPGQYEPREVSVRERTDGYEVLNGIGANDKLAKNALFLLDSDAVTNGSYMGESW